MDYKNLDVLNFKDKEFLLLGTAHISKSSVEEVEKIIASESIDSICVELDEERLKSIKNKNRTKDMDVIKIIKEKKVLFTMVNLILASYQKRLGEKLETSSGMEMIRGMELAQEKNINLVLADRNIQTTLSRVWMKSNFIDKINLLSVLVSSAFSDEKISEEELENFKNKEQLENVLNELSKNLPKVKEVLIDERDKYLAQNIYDSPGKRIFAIVGAGHKKGIIEQMKNIDANNEKVDLHELQQVPKKSFFLKLLPYVIPAFIIFIIALGFVKQDYDKALKNIYYWVFINGGLSAFFGILALANPIVVVLSFIFAPLTSLNPTIGVGFITGIAQAFLKKPTVSDLENISVDSKSLKGFYKNKFLKVLLVFFMTSLGSSIATFLAIPFLLK